MSIYQFSQIKINYFKLDEEELDPCCNKIKPATFNLLRLLNSHPFWFWRILTLVASVLQPITWLTAVATSKTKQFVRKF